MVRSQHFILNWMTNHLQVPDYRSRNCPKGLKIKHQKIDLDWPMKHNHGTIKYISYDKFTWGKKPLSSAIALTQLKEHIKIYTTPKTLLTMFK